MSKNIVTIFFRKKQKKNRVLVLLDFDNLLINFGGPPRTIIEALNTTLKKIAQEVGPVKVYVFVPYQNAQLFGESFYRAGFTTILCPKMKAKDGQTDIDTTDQMLTELGKELIDDMPGLTYLCLGSGDIDFASGDIGFPSLIQKANHYGLNIALIAGDLRSLSSELIKRADRKPNKEKMIYILPKPEKEI